MKHVTNIEIHSLSEEIETLEYALNIMLKQDFDCIYEIERTADECCKIKGRISESSVFTAIFQLMRKYAPNAGILFKID